MEGVGQKKGDEQICLLRNSPSGCISDFQEKPAIVSVHCISCDHHYSLAPHAYFAEQLSLLRCAVRYRACSEDRELQESSRSVRPTQMSVVLNGESLCSAGRRGRDDPCVLS